MRFIILCGCATIGFLMSRVNVSTRRHRRPHQNAPLDQTLSRRDFVRQPNNTILVDWFHTIDGYWLHELPQLMSKLEPNYHIGHQYNWTVLNCRCIHANTRFPREHFRLSFLLEHALNANLVQCLCFYMFTHFLLLLLLTLVAGTQMIKLPVKL